MTLLVTKRRSLASLGLCLTPARRAVAVASILVASGCATVPASETFIEIRPSEGSRWITSETVDRYGCASGALACETNGGRLAVRRCRCGAPP